MKRVEHKELVTVCQKVMGVILFWMYLSNWG